MIRIVIGSYFMAISLGLVQGLDQRAIFAPLLGLEMGDLIGTTLLFAITMAFMLGLYLGVTSVMLALFVLVSSIMQNFTPFNAQNIPAFWHDLTLICGILLSYFSLKTTVRRRTSFVGRRYVSRVVTDAKSITPRRVSPPTRVKAKSPPAHRPKMLLSASMPREKHAKPAPAPQGFLFERTGSEMSQRPKRAQPLQNAANMAKTPSEKPSGEDVVNIFAEI
jgi:hypothetical protein